MLDLAKRLESRMYAKQGVYAPSKKARKQSTNRAWKTDIPLPKIQGLQAYGVPKSHLVFGSVSKATLIHVHIVWRLIPSSKPYGFPYKFRPNSYGANIAAINSAPFLTEKENVAIFRDHAKNLYPVLD
jgi:hypothetical protein